MKRSFKKSLEGETEQSRFSGENAGNVLDGDTEALINKYSGMSETRLMRELKAATSRQKAEGKFDEASVKKGMDAIMPMLDEAQKRKLYEIMEKL